MSTHESRNEMAANVVETAPKDLEHSSEGLLEAGKGFASVC
jgi:hypothetical protein